METIETIATDDTIYYPFEGGIGEMAAPYTPTTPTTQTTRCYAFEGGIREYTE